MKDIKIADRTLCQKATVFSFKEKLEIARYLEKLNVVQIELPEIVNAKTDSLLIKTAASFVKKARISVSAGLTEESLLLAIKALEGIVNSGIRIELQASPVGLEYSVRKKGPKAIEWITNTIDAIKNAGIFAELVLSDATRAEEGFLREIIEASAKADLITLCDTAGETLPDKFAEFIKGLDIKVPVGVGCSNKNGLASAACILAVKAGADMIVTSAVGSDDVPLETVATIIKNCGNTNGISSSLRYTELNKIIKQINWVTDNNNDRNVVAVSNFGETGIALNENSTQDEIMTEVAKLGYDLSEEDLSSVYEAFKDEVRKKTVGARELDAIIASVALQVPKVFKLESYVVNTGNVIQATAQVNVTKDGELIQGVSMGDGPIDASLLALEQILGHHYELDDFQIQAVTEGKEAMGQAVVKIRDNGRLYSGKGISTDIIGASIRAYLSAINKIVYEEAN